MRERLSRCLVASLLTLWCFAASPAAEAKPKGDQAVNAVQGRSSLSIVGTAFCSEWTTLFAVPAGKRLVVEWMSAQSHILGSTADPVDVDVTTWNGTEFVTHPLVRLDDSVIKAGSLFGTQRWTSPVRLYSDGGEALRARMCPDAELTDETIGTVTFSGYLIDLP